MRMRCERCVLRNGLSPAVFALREHRKCVTSFDNSPAFLSSTHSLRNCKESPLKRESPRRDRSSSGEVILYKYRFLKCRLVGRYIYIYIRHDDGSTGVIFPRISLAAPFFEYSIRPDITRGPIFSPFSVLCIFQTRSRMPRRTIFSNLFHQVGSPYGTFLAKLSLL
ncbi:hypothetical protein ACS0PU_006714 [Formica fusca]